MIFDFEKKKHQDMSIFSRGVPVCEVRTAENKRHIQTLSQVVQTARQCISPPPTIFLNFLRPVRWQVGSD